ncbi:hypothetical protein B0I33_10344 [Prauserella shujinwangii]|uniref:Uncharacterized protein n=1 Tax=Prauserella shujinwangii TaxID=1453103 RepID=A0A2T0LY81_9PSEU|nr:hypothetical protein [Prauserella shujinwangii]PRX49012.1 hypothetical protein B0I33_10344 [Prauserella shujinwangii]
MTDDPDKRARDLERRRVRTMVALTVLGPVLIVLAFVFTEPHWILWVLAGAIVTSAIAFWATYALQRHLRREADG